MTMAIDIEPWSKRLNDRLPHCACGARVDHAWPFDAEFQRGFPEFAGANYEGNARLLFEALDRIETNSPSLYAALLRLQPACDLCVKRDHEQRTSAARAQRLRSAYSDERMPAEMQGWTFEAADEAAKSRSDVAESMRVNAEVWQWARRTTGLSNVWIAGNTGRGKSFLVACALNSLIERGHKAGLVRGYELREAIFSKQKSVIQKARDCSPLCIDDMHAARWDAYTLPGLLEILDHRSNAKKATWFTANVTCDGLFGAESELRKNNAELRTLISPIVGRIWPGMAGFTMTGQHNLRKAEQTQGALL